MTIIKKTVTNTNAWEKQRTSGKIKSICWGCKYKETEKGKGGGEGREGGGREGERERT